MATNFYNLFKPLTFLVSNAHFWLWHRCFLRVSPKPSSFGCIFPLWHRCFPLDFTGALFFVPSRDSAFSAILFELCFYLWPIACFCEFLMLNTSGCCRHCVSNTFVQLTEGRSARDQPKQPPAKKKSISLLLPPFLVVSYLRFCVDILFRTFLDFSILSPLTSLDLFNSPLIFFVILCPSLGVSYLRFCVGILFRTFLDFSLFFLLTSSDFLRLYSLWFCVLYFVSPI